jgi:two-component system chemotaxis response regulator CheB
MLVNKSGAKYYVDIVDGPLINRHRPSVDMLFRSTAQLVGKNAVGIILTGMGDDGANGLLEMKQAGAYTIAQDEGSSAVYGMPRAAIELGAANKVLNIDDMAGYIIGIISGKKKVNV